nr:hypothetical protein [Kineosporia sp. NBRC 101731]
MTLLESALEASALLCLLAVLSPERVRRATAAGTGALLLALTTAALAAEGLRWQFTGVIGAGLIAVALAGFRVATQRPRTKRGHVALGLVLTMGFASLLGGAAAIWGFRPLDLPDPQGQYAVGTRTAYWTDPTRDEPATTASDRRRVTAQIWYPTTGSGPQAPYLGRQPQLVAEGLGRSFGVPAFLFGEAADGHGHSTENAPLPATSETYGIVLFSPGLLSVRTQNTAWAEYLAARGYVVVALDHPYDSAVTFTQDGRPLWSKVRATGDDTHDNRDADHLTAIRAQDLSFALDRIEADAFFRRRLDTGRVAVTGHSVGGAAALQAAAQDSRFRAAIDIDGLPRGGARPRQPVLALVAGDQQDNAAYQQALAQVLAENPLSRRITVKNTKHLSFTDAPFFLPDLPVLFGPADREQAYTAMTGATQTFLEEVSGKTSLEPHRGFLHQVPGERGHPRSQRHGEQDERHVRVLPYPETHQQLGDGPVPDVHPVRQVPSGLPRRGQTHHRVEAQVGEGRAADPPPVVHHQQAGHDDGEAGQSCPAVDRNPVGEEETGRTEQEHEREAQHVRRAQRVDADLTGEGQPSEHDDQGEHHPRPPAQYADHAEARDQQIADGLVEQRPQRTIDHVWITTVTGQAADAELAHEQGGVLHEVTEGGVGAAEDRGGTAAGQDGHQRCHHERREQHDRPESGQDAQRPVPQIARHRQAQQAAGDEKSTEHEERVHTQRAHLGDTDPRLVPEPQEHRVDHRHDGRQRESHDVERVVPGVERRGQGVGRRGGAVPTRTRPADGAGGSGGQGHASSSRRRWSDVEET